MEDVERFAACFAALAVALAVFGAACLSFEQNGNVGRLVGEGGKCHTKRGLGGIGLERG